MNEVYVGKYYDSKLEKEVEFEYVKKLTMRQKVDFVNNVLEVLFQNDYCYSIIKNEIVYIMLIDTFTNILKTDEDFGYKLNEIEEFLSNTNAIDVLLKEIPSAYIRELDEVIDENIAYKTGINKDNLSTAFSSLLRTIENKVSDFDMNELTTTLKELGDMTSGLSQETLMDLYTKTDAYKENYENVVQSKNEEIRKLKEENEEK